MLGGELEIAWAFSQVYMSHQPPSPGLPGGSLHYPSSHFSLTLAAPLSSATALSPVMGAQSLPLSSVRGVQHVLLIPSFLSWLFASSLLMFFLNSYGGFSQTVPVL